MKYLYPFSGAAFGASGCECLTRGRTGALQSVFRPVRHHGHQDRKENHFRKAASEVQLWDERGDRM